MSFGDGHVVDVGGLQDEGSHGGGDAAVVGLIGQESDAALVAHHIELVVGRLEDDAATLFHGGVANAHALFLDGLQVAEVHGRPAVAGLVKGDDALPVAGELLQDLSGFAGVLHHGVDAVGALVLV